MSKKEFIDALHEVPKALEDRVFGTIETIGMPSDEESAILAIGKLSANINNQILRPLSGLDVTELLLRVGQRSSTAIAGLLSGLEIIVGNSSGFEVISPEDGSLVETYCEFVCSGAGIVSVEVSVSGETIKLQAKGDKFRGFPDAPLSAGKHSATFTATFGDKSTDKKNINFEATTNINIVSTFPQEGQSYTPGQVNRIEITLTEEAAAKNDTIQVSVFGQTLELTGNGIKYAKEIGEIGAEWVKLNQMTVLNKAGELMGQIQFLITGGSE